MSEVNIGKTPESTAKRDAVHVALAPIVAGENLAVNDRVHVRDGKAYRCTSQPTGIVDPFRDTPVVNGAMFWLFMYPNTIRSIRHDWQHPDVPDSAIARDPEGESMRYMEGYANSINRSVGYVLERIRERDSIIADGVDQHSWEYDGPVSEFWRHAEILIGESIPASYRDDFVFSCSC